MHSFTQENIDNHFRNNRVWKKIFLEKYPNYTPEFKIYNLSSAPVPIGWTVEFDLPKSTRYDATWGTGTLSLIDDLHPLWNRWKVVGPSSVSIPAGGSYAISGAMKLCFSGGPLNVVFNGSSSAFEKNLPIDTSCQGVTGVDFFTKNENLLNYL